MCGAKHGYEMLQFLEDFLGATWYISTSQLYTLLKRLERQGLVTSTVKAQESRPSKRVFFLTKKGKETFQNWLSTPSNHVRDLRVEFLAKIFFIKKLSMPGGVELLERQIEVLRKNRKKMVSKEKEEEDPYRKLVFGFKRVTIDAWLEWLKTQAKDFICG